MRCVKYERFASKVKRVPYIPYHHQIMDASGRCSRSVWQV